MTFLLGTTCWHVVGYTNEHHTVLLCGAKPHDPIGGGPVDVIKSEMRVCSNCDKATGGEAARYVERAKELV